MRELLQIIRSQVDADGIPSDYGGHEEIEKHPNEIELHQ